MKIYSKEAAGFPIHRSGRMKQIGIDKNSIPLPEKISAILYLKINLSLCNHQHFKLLMPMKIKDNIRPCRIAHFMQTNGQLCRTMLLLFLVLLFSCHPDHLLLHLSLYIHFRLLLNLASYYSR